MSGAGREAGCLIAYAMGCGERSFRGGSVMVSSWYLCCGKPMTAILQFSQRYYPKTSVLRFWKAPGGGLLILRPISLLRIWVSCQWSVNAKFRTAIFGET